MYTFNKQNVKSNITMCPAKTHRSFVINVEPNDQKPKWAKHFCTTISLVIIVVGGASSPGL